MLGRLTGRRRIFLSVMFCFFAFFCIPVFSVVKQPDQAVNQVEFFLFWLLLSADVFGLFLLSGTQIGTRITFDTGDVFCQQQQSR